MKYPRVNPFKQLLILSETCKYEQQIENYFKNPITRILFGTESRFTLSLRTWELSVGYMYSAITAIFDEHAKRRERESEIINLVTPNQGVLAENFLLQGRQRLY